MQSMQIEAIVAAQRAFFATEKTRTAAFRRHALTALRGALAAREKEICAALQADLHKSAFEGYMCEVGLVLSEIDYMLKNLTRLMRPRHAKTPLAQFSAKSFVVPEPLGISLIMSPWNYPVLLSLDPLVGAIAAGCCAVVKPSAYAPATSRVLREVLESCFPPEYIAVVEGGRAENEALLEQRFDSIFFTGSVAVGKLVMEKAARFLTPVTLELGGKSPCIIDETANLALAARRLVFGKYLNAGQTCVAPDYVLVQGSVRDELLELVQAEIAEQFGEQPLENPDYGRIVNERHYRRLMGLTQSGRVVCGGVGRAETLQIAPTVLCDVSPESPVMQEEIFGPILPVLTVRTLGEAMEFVNARPKPLALYLFTTDKTAEQRVLRGCSFGGGCVNDTVIHLATSDMGFGGVGESGMGSYHGKLSFDTFTHYKSIVHKANWIDLGIRYQPYTQANEALLRLFLR